MNIEVIKMRLSKILLVIFLTIPSQLFADDDVFARQGDLVLTQAELDAAFSQIPPEHRLPFIRDGGQVDKLVQKLLRYKQVAKDAEKNGFAKDPNAQLRMKLAAEEELAKAWIQNKIENMPEGDYDALAQEYYLANPEEFQSQDAVDVSHILIKSDIRPEEEALATIIRLHTELLENPSLFDEYIEKYSEDPAKTNNKGRYPRIVEGQMVKPFEEMAFSMQEVGSISEPVQTSYGFHILRLNNKMPPALVPFEQVKPKLIQKMYANYAETYRVNYVLGVSHGTIELEEGAVEKMVKRHFGENLELAPGYYDQ